ncbi:MAG: sulfur carrier protein ThiS [Streptosporangiaceae bacterium]|jgi:sulfur carrier protein
MNITINGTSHDLTDGASLATAVSLLTTSATGLAAAINGELVRRADWDATGLADGDSVEVITAVQGG